MEEELTQSLPENLTKIISPAKATTPSITKTLKSAKTRISDKITADKVKEDKTRIQKVMISKIKIEIKSHSETVKKTVSNKNQRKSTKR